MGCRQGEGEGDCRWRGKVGGGGLVFAYGGWAGGGGGPFCLWRKLGESFVVWVWELGGTCGGKLSEDELTQGVLGHDEAGRSQEDLGDGRLNRPGGGGKG